MKLRTIVFSWWLTIPLIVSGTLSLTGCCPYSRGLVVDVTDRTQSSAIGAYGFAVDYLETLGYGIWQKDEPTRYVRGSIKRESPSVGFRVEDVLTVSIADSAGGAQFQITAETYKLGPRREKVRVSKEARADANKLKESLLQRGR